MRFLWVILLGVVGAAGVGGYLVVSANSAQEAASNFCGSTRIGEPFPQLQGRAEHAGVDFVKGRATKDEEEWLVQTSSLTRRFGCAITLKGGLVMDKHFGELPPNER